MRDLYDRTGISAVCVASVLEQWRLSLRGANFLLARTVILSLRAPAKQSPMEQLGIAPLWAERLSLAMTVVLSLRALAKQSPVAQAGIASSLAKSARSSQ